MNHTNLHFSPNTIPVDAVSLADYERYSVECLSDSVNSYLNGGSADQVTLNANLASWNSDSKAVIPRVLNNLAGVNTRIQLLNRELVSPLLIAPIAYHKLFHVDGELGTLAAADACEVPYVVSTQSSCTLEEIAAHREEAPLWFQLYFQQDLAATEELIHRAEAAGYEALVVTVDAPINGIRNAEQRAQFKLPPEVKSVNLWSGNDLDEKKSALDPDFITSLPTWKSLADLRKITRLPILLKGIMHSDDALRAIEIGADGVIVSNHGGRTLDTVATTQSVLAGIAQAVDGEVAVVVDGGIRRGTDVLRAMALGADAVLIGRPILHGLSVAGALGAAHVLKLLQHELEVAMVLSGCQSFSHAKQLFA